VSKRPDPTATQFTPFLRQGCVCS